MVQITEDYVSFEIAKLLKEKGFNKDAYTMSMYDENGEVKDVLLLKEGEEPVLRPTLQMAMKWLREVHKIVPIILAGGDSYWFRIDKANEDNWKNTIYIEDEKLFPTYEEACEASIKYCLENLI